MSLRQALRRTGTAWHQTAYGQGTTVTVVYLNGHRCYAVHMPGNNGASYYRTLEEVEMALKGQEQEGWETRA